MVVLNCQDKFSNFTAERRTREQYSHNGYSMVYIKDHVSNDDYGDGDGNDGGSGCCCCCGELSTEKCSGF